MEGNIVEKAQAFLMFRQGGLSIIEALDQAGLIITEARRAQLLEREKVEMNYLPHPDALAEEVLTGRMGGGG